MNDNKALKFLHFNIDRQDSMSKRMFQIWQSRTVAALAVSPHAIRKFSVEYLAQEADQKMTIPMAVGIAFVSKDDNYNRSVGRDEAVKQMTEIDLEIVGININQTHIYLNLAPYKGVALTLRLNKKTGFSTVTGTITGRIEDRK